MHARGNLRRYRTVSDYKEINRLLERCEQLCLLRINWGINTSQMLDPIKDPKSDYLGLGVNYIVHEALTQFEVTTEYGDNQLPTTYKFALNEQYLESVAGQTTYMEFSKAFKVPNLTNNELAKEWLGWDNQTQRFLLSARPELGHRHKTEIIEYHNCYEYDINSAFSYYCLDMIPDLESCETDRVVQDGEVGFLLTDDLEIVDKGFANVIFKLIPAPHGLKTYVYKWYTAKRNSTGQDKQNAKLYLNAPIGYAQLKNPFFRAYVIGRCNQRIRNLLDKYPSIFMWNTDAVFSTEPLDLDIGPEIGQFKEIKINRLRCNGVTYQADDDIPVYRGIPKAWFKAFEKDNGRPFNLLKDSVPERCNVYYYDREKNRLEISEWAKD